MAFNYSESQWSPALGPGYDVGAGPAGAQSWDHQAPPTRSGTLALIRGCSPGLTRPRSHPPANKAGCSGASSTVPREEPTAFFYQYQRTCSIALPPGSDTSCHPHLKRLWCVETPKTDWLHTEVEKAFSEMIKSGKIQPGMGMPPGGRREFPPHHPPGPARFYTGFGEFSHTTRMLLGRVSNHQYPVNMSLSSTCRASPTRGPSRPTTLSRIRRPWWSRPPFHEPAELLCLPAPSAISRLQRCRADAAAQEEVGSPAGARAAKLPPGTAIQPK